MSAAATPLGDADGASMSAAATPVGAVGRRRRPAVRSATSPRRVLAVAALGAGLAFIDATIVNVAFPDIRRDFPGTSLDGLSWVLNAYNIVFAAFLVAAGRLADLLGRRRLFAGGVVLFTLASVLCAAAPSVGLLVAARVLQALGAAIVVPASLALVLEAFKDGSRSQGVALWSASAALAAGLGPSLGGLLVELGGWRLAFLVNLPVGILAYVAARRTLVESRAPGRRRVPDLAGAGLMAVATAALTLGIIKGQDWGWASPGVLGSFAAAAVVGGVFVRRCTWHRAPLIDLGLLRIRSVSVANVLTLLGASGFYAYVLCNVLFLTTAWGYSVLEAGLALTPGPFVAAAVAGPAGKLADRVGARVVLAAGGLVWAAGVYYLTFAIGARPEFLGEWLPAMVILGIGAGVTFPVVGSTAVAAVPGGRFATATGLNSISRQLGAVLGVALLVAIVGTPEPAQAAAAFDRGWTFAAACFLALAVGALFLGRVARPERAAGADDAAPAVATPVIAPERPRPATPVGAQDLAPAEQLTPAQLLARAPLFAPLGADARAGIAGRASIRSLRAGEWLFREGDEADALYVVASGRVEVDGAELMGPGGVLGELALVSDTRRTSSARARRDSELLEVGRDQFERLLADAPGFSRAMLRAMGERLRDARPSAPAPARPGGVIALVPLQPGLPVGEVAFGLSYTLQRWERVARVDASSELADGADVGLIERLEREHERVLLVTAPPGERPEWTDFCLRHADRVLALARPGAVPAETARMQGCDLMFVSGDPGAAAPWLEALEPRSVHALAGGEELLTGVERAGRRLAGRSVGVVLSGGGARALAHIGVLEELVRAGLQIDRVGGCSMGAFIAAMAAAGLDMAEIDSRCYEEWVKRNPLNDYRLPRVSLLRGDKMRELLRRNLPGAIEELPRDYFCTSCDLATGEPVVHRRGELWEAVAASMCIPGLAPPRAIGGRLLVDGGVVNNLPVEEMAVAAEGPVIAVDVTNRFDPGVQPDDVPGFAETLQRTLMLGSADTVEAARRYADLTIRPENDGVGLFEFHQLDRMRDAGQRAAVEALERAPRGVLW